MIFAWIKLYWTDTFVVFKLKVKRGLLLIRYYWTDTFVVFKCKVSSTPNIGSVNWTDTFVVFKSVSLPILKSSSYIEPIHLLYLNLKRFGELFSTRKIEPIHLLYLNFIAFPVADIKGDNWTDTFVVFKSACLWFTIYFSNYWTDTFVVFKFCKYSIGCIFKRIEPIHLLYLNTVGICEPLRT